MVRHFTLDYWWRGNNSLISSLDGERRCDGINLSQGDNVAPAEVPTAKWQRENVGESEVG